MDDFTKARVNEVVGAITDHCLTGAKANNGNNGTTSEHMNWAYPVLHVPFFSNTFVAAYLYAKALKIVLKDCSGLDKKSTGIQDLIVQQEWSQQPIQIMSQYRFNIFFSESEACTPNIQHLMSAHILQENCFSYLHTQAFTDSTLTLAQIMRAEKPLIIITDIPAEAAKVKNLAIKACGDMRKVSVVELGSRSVGSVLSDPSSDAAIRLFFFGSPKTELFFEENDGREGCRNRSVVKFEKPMRLGPVKTDLAIHFKYSEDESAAKEFLKKLADSVRKCIKATDPKNSADYEKAGPFFIDVVEKYNRLARSIAVGNQIPERIKSGTKRQNSERKNDLYRRSIASHATT